MVQSIYVMGDHSAKVYLFFIPANLFVNIIYIVYFSLKLLIMSKETKSATVSAKVKPAVKKKLEAMAKKADRKVSYIVSQILTAGVEN